jgi:tetratricopeptide (TPR) repeat protein
VHYDLGHAYMTLPDIGNLDAAEAAYRRSLDLADSNDALHRSMCVEYIGTVHYRRFLRAHEQGMSGQALLTHAQAAEKCFQQALDLCPARALTKLGAYHLQLANLYREVAQLESAREHYEKGVQLYERIGERHGAGVTRLNMAIMHLYAANLEESQGGQRYYLLRAQAYAQAALRDFQRYQGRAADEEADAQQLLDDIEQRLAELAK